MLDLRWIRENVAEVKEAMAKRGTDVSVDGLLQADERRRALLRETEELKARRNTVSQEVAKRKKAREDADDIIAEMARYRTGLRP